MTPDGKETTVESLTLRSQLTDMARLPVWIEILASRYAIPNQTQFAINLCLEEAVSNVILHGYSSQPDGLITVRFDQPREDYYVFDVEDEAPLFNPINAPEPLPADSLDDFPVGGQGIRLLRQFADSLEHQATQKGNRLSIGFSAAPSSVTKNSSVRPCVRN